MCLLLSVGNYLVFPANILQTVTGAHGKLIYLFVKIYLILILLLD